MNFSKNITNMDIKMHYCTNKYREIKDKTTLEILY